MSSTDSDPALTPVSRVATEESWDLIDELPMRWATDYVPLAPASGRNGTMDVTRFELHQADGSFGGSGSLLAVASKTNILIFEAPRGERAFRFVKVICAAL